VRLTFAACFAWLPFLTKRIAERQVGALYEFKDVGVFGIGTSDATDGHVSAAPTASP
jgi:hypothetical protein